MQEVIIMIRPDIIRPDIVRSKLEEALRQKTCMKHAVVAVIETRYEQYIIGWNGAPTRGIEHYECLRKGMPSGQGMEICPTVHAEVRAIGSAARKGISLEYATMYMDGWFPCEDCTDVIIESGIYRLVTPDEVYSDKANHILVPGLRNQPYNFENSERLIRNARIEIIIDPRIRPSKK